MQPATRCSKEEWFENESFWEDFYPVLFPEELFDQAQEEMEKIFELIDHPVSSVLDLCCGPGRFAGLLAREGYQVTGVDRTPFLLEIAKREYADTEHVEWVLSDMREFVRQESYDLVLNLYTSFGYFKDPAEDLLVLKNIAQSLRPGGSFVIEVMGKEVMAKDFEPISASKVGDGIFVQSHEIFENWKRIRTEWTLINEGNIRTFTFEHSLYAASDLIRLCELAGLSDIRVFGDFDGRPYDHSAILLVITGRKN
jgi:SAM-dependent methyltransferase